MTKKDETQSDPERSGQRMLVCPFCGSSLPRSPNVNAELLEACKRLLKFNEELCEDMKVSKHYPSADFARRVIAEAAIAEAG